MENPYLGHPSLTFADSWASGFFHGYSDPVSSLEPPLDVPPEAADVYAEGHQAGVQASIDGIEPGLHCIGAAESDSAHWLATGGWSAWTAGAFLVGPAGVTAMFARGLLSVLRFGWSGKHALPVTDVLPDVAQPLLDALEAYGIGSMVIYAGAGVDPLSLGCEIQATGFYPSLEDARSALAGMGRQDWALLSWRNDMSNSFQVEESSGQI